jgi:hypothetical protein
MSDRRIYRGHKHAAVGRALAAVAFAVYVIAVLQVIAVVRIHLHPKADLLVLLPTDNATTQRTE